MATFKITKIETCTITFTRDELMTLKSSLNKALQSTIDGVECVEIINLKNKVTSTEFK